MAPFDPSAHALSVNRRAFLTQSAYGLGGMAFAALAGQSAAGVPGALAAPHTPVRAKRVIFLCMAGGPSHLETFDWKPRLKALDGKPFPESFTRGQQLAQLQNAELMGPIRPGDRRHLPPPRRRRRRTVRDPLDADRADQS
jgi:hypothetical protein